MNDDGQVTGGSVRVQKRTAATGTYEHDEVAVTLNFTVREDRPHQELLVEVGNEAQAETRRLLGLPALTKAPAKATVKPANKAAIVQPPKVEPADVVVFAPVTEAVKQADLSVEPSCLAVEVPTKQADPMAMEEDPIPLASAAPSEPTTTAGSTDPTAMVEDEWTAAREVTDKDLLEAITRVNARLQKPKDIHALLAKFIPAGQAARTLPADKRVQFVKELEALR